MSMDRMMANKHRLMKRMGLRPHVIPGDITLRLGSLMLDLGNGDAVHIGNFDRNDVFNSSSIDSFEFADGTTLTTTELLERGFDLNGTDILTGTNITDRIHGLAVDDQIYVFGAGNDILQGEDGNDTAGDDFLYRDAANDECIAHHWQCERKVV